MTREIQLNTDSVAVKNGEGAVARMILTFLAAAGIAMGFFSEFDIEVSVLYVLPVCAAASVLMQILFVSRKRTVIGLSVTAVVLGAACVCFAQKVENGFAVMANQLLTTVNKNMAMANLLFVADEDGSNADLMAAAAILILLVTIVMAALIRLRMNICAAILVFAGVIVGMLYHDEGSPVWMAAALTAVFGILGMGNIRGHITIDMYVKQGILLLLAGAVSAAVFFFVGYEPVQTVDEIKSAIVYRGGNLLYGKSDYPEGEFSRFDDVTVTGEERLRVTSDKPVTLYLRGYVAAKYTSEGWEESDQDIYGGDYAGVFEWFQQNGYSPLTNLAAYIDESVQQGSESVSTDKVTVSVENTGARTKYQYLPESLTYSSLSGLYAAKNDVNFRVQGFHTQKSYTFEIDEVTDGDYRALYGAEWYKNGSGTESFLDSENVYGIFARTYYMDVPDEVSSYFANHVEYAGETLNPFDALSVVREYLRNNIEYDENVEEYSGAEDFAVDLLENKRKGYSAHYASAAALLFRYYGVPARYVEGYLYVPSGTGTTVLTDEDAHAWVEVYISGLGFIPFEVTPGFYNEDEDDSAGGGGSGSAGSSRKQDDQDDDQNQNNDDDSSLNLIWLLYAALILVCLFLLVVIVRRIIICIRRKHAMFSDDREVSIGASGILMGRLADFCGQELEKLIEKDVKEALQRYRFGNGMPTEEEAVLIRDAAVRLQKEVSSHQSFAGGLRLRYVACLR